MHDALQPTGNTSVVLGHLIYQSLDFFIILKQGQLLCKPLEGFQMIHTEHGGSFHGGGEGGCWGGDWWINLPYSAGIHPPPGTPPTCTPGRSGKLVTWHLHLSWTDLTRVHRGWYLPFFLAHDCFLPWLVFLTKPCWTCIELGSKCFLWMDLGVQAFFLEDLMYSPEETKRNSFHRKREKYELQGMVC